MFERSLLPRLGKSLLREAAIVGIAGAAIVFIFRIAGLLKSDTFMPPPIRRLMKGSLVTVGEQVRLRSANFAGHPVSLVIVSAPDCGFCIQSEAFHRRLLAEAERADIPFYVVVPEQREATDYLRTAGLSAAVVRQWSDLSGRVPGTPTIIAVDSSGTARQVWVGRLPAEVEADILKVILRDPKLDAVGSEKNASPSFPSADDLRKRSQFGKMQIIEIHERGEPARSSDAITLPFIELSTRAPFELDRAAVQVVECSNLYETECSSAVAILSNLGFQVATIGAGSLYENCELSKVN